MGMFDQFKIAADIQIRKVVDEEIKKRDLISRKEALEMLSKSNC